MGFVIMEVGELFEYKGVTLKVVENIDTESNGCSNCYFQKRHCNWQGATCTEYVRPDEKSIHYEEV